MAKFGRCTCRLCQIEGRCGESGQCYAIASNGTRDCHRKVLGCEGGVRGFSDSGAITSLCGNCVDGWCEVGLTRPLDPDDSELADGAEGRAPVPEVGGNTGEPAEETAESSAPVEADEPVSPAVVVTQEAEKPVTAMPHEFCYMMAGAGSFGGEQEFSYDARRAPLWHGGPDTYRRYKRTLQMWWDQSELHGDAGSPDAPTKAKALFNLKRVGPSIVGRIDGGQAQEWITTQCDLELLNGEGGKKYLIQELDKIYLRSNFERVFTTLMNYFQYSRADARRQLHDTKLTDRNEYEYFLANWETKRQLNAELNTATEAVKLPEYVEAMLLLHAAQLSESQRMAILRELPAAEREDGTKLTMAAVKSAFRYVLVPDPELRKIREAARPQRGFFVNEEDVYYDPDQDAYLAEDGDGSLVECEYDDAEDGYFVKGQRKGGKGASRGRGRPPPPRRYGSAPRTDRGRESRERRAAFEAEPQDYPHGDESADDAYAAKGKGKGAIGGSDRRGEGDGKSRRNVDGRTCHDCGS